MAEAASSAFLLFLLGFFFSVSPLAVVAALLSSVTLLLRLRLLLLGVSAEACALESSAAPAFDFLLDLPDFFELVSLAVVESPESAVDFFFFDLDDDFAELSVVEAESSLLDFLCFLLVEVV